MEFIPVSSLHAQKLYRLFEERPEESYISTEAKPSYFSHVSFVERHPYRQWYVIEIDGKMVGSIYLGQDNSIGVAIFKEHQRKGYATQAIEKLMDLHNPAPGIPSVRSGDYLANIAPSNQESIKLFEKLGFELIQQTYGRKK